MIDPIRVRRLLVTLLKLLVVLELAGAFLEGISQGQWERFGVDLIVAGVLYLAWERIIGGLEQRKEYYRQRLEESPQNIGVRDALMFSLLASEEIYLGIPQDRRRLVVVSYTLISIGLLAAFIKVGSGLMPLVVSGALVLGAVNLVVWVVSQERGEREALRTELKLAHDVQMSLMPREQPSVPRYDIAGVSSPAREVGGDFYDYSCLASSQELLGIAVFDVSGKGVQAAMSALFASGAYCSEARVASSPAEILTRLNRTVYLRSKRGHFIAFLLVALDPSSGRLVFANAGQTRPLLVSNGHLQTLDSVGVHFPLGMQEDTIYKERELSLQPGDKLVLLTDGFTDAMNGRREQYGVERVEKMLLDPGMAGASAQQTIDYLMQDIRQFAGGAPQHDDMTMVVLRRT